jgi:hypothetical protein
MALLCTAAERNDDPAVLAQLVRLRHDAYATVPRELGRPEWPPATEAPVRDGLPPEIDAAELDAAAVATGIRTRGCLLVRGLLDAARVEHLSDVVERAYRAAESGGPDGDGWFVPFEAPGANLAPRRGWARKAGAMWIGDSPRAMQEVLRTLDELALPDVLTDYFGVRPVFTLEKATLRRVTPDVTPDWHQDGAFMGRDLRSLNLWITLTGCAEDADVPALDILPRRLEHFVETGTAGALLDDFVGRQLVEELAQDCPVVRPRFEPGDALVFDDRFLHCTGVGPGTTGERRGLELWFFAPATVPESYQTLVL